MYSKCSMQTASAFLLLLVGNISFLGAQCPSNCPDRADSECNGLCEAGGQSRDLCAFGVSSGGCPSGKTPQGGCCCNPTPILIDTDGGGIAFDGPDSGPLFDIGGSGSVRVSWPVPTSRAMWLALDRDNNGRIDNGRELFGNATSQPPPPAGHFRNGFFALAQFDRPESGGNADGIISRADMIFESLKLWHDANANGISETGELYSLMDIGIVSIDLSFKDSKKEDIHGNLFRYRSKVRLDKGSPADRWAWDIVLRVSNSGVQVTSHGSP
jgi:hypothetical protein